MSGSAPVFAVDKTELLDARPGLTVILTGQQAHHAVRVRRLRSGESVDLVDGYGCRASGIVADDPSPDRVSIVLGDIDREAPRRPRVVVAQALIKGDRTDRAIETMTEVGVDEIIPWSAERSVVRWRGEKAVAGARRWETIAREAAKQSRQAWFPRVHPLCSLEGLCEVVAQAEFNVVLDVAGEPLSSMQVPTSGDLVVVVGPEGGLTANEIAQLRAVGAHLIRLGPSILRSATAGTVAAVALLSRSPRWPS